MSKNTPFKDTVLFISAAFFASFLILGFLCPDLWFFHTRRLCADLSSSVLYNSLFLMVSNFYHGGIQLWDRFGQVNNAYYMLSSNIYSVMNIITAFFSFFFCLFLPNPGEVLYHTHLFLFYGVMCLIRTIGGYVLLRKLTSNKAIIFVSIIFLNTILTNYMTTPDFALDGVFSFFPLLLYYILCFFEDYRLRSFLLASLVMALSFVSCPLGALSYFYQVVHGFILGCVLAFFLQRGWRKLQGRPRLPRIEFIKNMGLAICCFLIILPYGWWIHSLMHDFYVHNSGLAGTHGRLSLFFNFSGYFYTERRSFADPFEFIGTSLNYHPSICWASWIFIGGSALFLALAGIVLSKDKRKYIFAGAILFIILLNTACYPNNFHVLGWNIHYAWRHPSDFWMGKIPFDLWVLSIWMFISSITHGINALTNPFCCLVRSFQEPAILMAMLFAPLMAMGLESCFHWWHRRIEAIYYQRRWVLLIFGACVLFWDLSGGTQTLPVFDTEYGNKLYGGAAQNLNLYILCLITTFLTFMLMAEYFPRRSRWVGWMILGFAFAADLTGLMVCNTSNSLINTTTVPVRLNPTHYIHQAFVPDYQNPKILPVREFFNTQTEDISPLFADDNFYMIGDFYQYIPMGRFFRPWSLYSVRPISYKNLYPDFEIQQYLTKNPHTIFFADYAFDSQHLNFADILRLNLGSRVIVVKGEKYNRSFIKNLERVSVAPMEIKKKFYNVSLDLGKARIHKNPSGWEYIFDLPVDFPFYLSTSVFSDDYASWKLVVNGRVLAPMQGKLTAPYTYDVQNIQDKKLTVLLPDPIKQGVDINLQVKLPDGILNVWKNTYDDLGFTYQAPKAGWLVFNYPYDEKWELSIDNHKTPISKANRYFIGAPISGGVHQVLLRYWPHTLLRSWIFISIVLSIVCFVWILCYSIRREPLY